MYIRAKFWFTLRVDGDQSSANSSIQWSRRWPKVAS